MTDGVVTISRDRDLLRKGARSLASKQDNDLEGDGEETHALGCFEQNRAHPSSSPADSNAVQLLVTPVEAARRLSLGRTTVYALMASGHLASIRIGRSRRIPVTELRMFVERAATEQRERLMADRVAQDPSIS
jgi:excisionase family DNA binding protein